MIFTALEKNHIPEIISLSNVLFGENYLNEKSLTSYLTTPHKKSIIVLESNSIIGFLLADILTYQEFTTYVSSGKKWFKEQFSSYKTICLIKQIAVHPTHQKKRIARQLFESIDKTTRDQVDISCCLAWIKGEESPLNGILTHNGFKKKITIENYWHQESIKKDYNCAICGPSPCLCSAAIYIK